MRGRRALLGLMALGAFSGCTVVGAPASFPAPPAEVEPPPAAEPAPETEAASAEPVGDVLVPGHPLLRPVRPFREVRGLWVVRSTMTSAEEVRAMVENAASAGFNTLLVQVRGRADAFYRSSLEPRAETITDPEPFDPLALTIEEAHRRGMAVHAWVNTHLVWGPTARPRSPQHIVNAHPDWLAVPRALARELYDLDPGAPRYVDALRRYAEANPDQVVGLYTSPSHPAVQDRVHSVWMDLLERYDLDGIHFDYIRFPSWDFDYSRGSLERFARWMGEGRAGDGAPGSGELPVSEAMALVDARPEEWGAFQRAQITDLVRRIYTDVKARRPEVVVSAAVFANVTDAYRARFQDWRAWLAEGIIDVAVPMAYTPQNGLFGRQIADARSAAGARERTWAGIGAYLNGLEGTLDKIDLARAEDAGGVVLFSYDWAVESGLGEDPEPFLERVGRERFGAP